jgi:hypothetical protein
MIGRLRSLAMVVTKQTAEPISGGNFSFDTPDLRARLNEPVTQPLVIALGVIVLHKLGQCATYGRPRSVLATYPPPSFPLTISQGGSILCMGSFVDA